MDGGKKKLLAALVIALVITGAGLYSWWQKNTIVTAGQFSSQAAGQNALAAAGKADTVIVYISGGINKPGMYELNKGLRVLDAVNLAGGLTPDADANRINMAEVVKDGSHVAVPIAAAGSKAGDGTGTRQEKISINTADKNELDKLPGIGPAMAERILEYRQAKGAFKNLEELKNIPGIGEAKFNKLVNKISL